MLLLEQLRRLLRRARRGTIDRFVRARASFRRTSLRRSWRRRPTWVGGQAQRSYTGHLLQTRAASVAEEEIGSQGGVEYGEVIWVP